MDKPLSISDKEKIERGLKLEDGISKLSIDKALQKDIMVTMSEGRNRQIRRTFSALGYKIVDLNRLAFGDYKLGNLKSGEYKEVRS